VVQQNEINNPVTAVPFGWMTSHMQMLRNALASVRTKMMFVIIKHFYQATT